MRKLARNAVKCSTCLTVIESKHRHDFVRCKCPTDDTAVWVDGGLDYQRMLMGNSASWTDLSETTKSENVECQT